MHFTLRQLEVFLAIAETQNITQAAEKVHLTQSAASMALQDLENALDAPLFIRQHRKKLTLTPAGEQLRPLAFNMLEQGKLITTFKQEKKLAGQVTIGASTTIGNFVLPTLISNFTQEHPDLNLKLEIANTKEIIKKLENWQYDFALIEGSPYASDLIIEPWLEDELLIFTHYSHPLAKKKHLELKDLEHESWVLRELGSGTRELMEGLLKQISSVKSTLTISSSEAIKAIVKQGNHLSCLSHFVLKEDLEHHYLKQLVIKDFALKRRFYLLRTPRRILSPAAQALLTRVRNFL